MDYKSSNFFYNDNHTNNDKEIYTAHYYDRNQKNQSYNRETNESYMEVEQEDGNIIFTGSPYSTRKDEAGDHYFAVIDGTDCELIEYNEAPDYMTVYLEEAITDPDIDYNNKIVEVIINSKIENFVKLRDIMISKGAVEVNAKFEKTNTADSSVRSKIDTNEGVAVSMVKYLKESKKSGINNDKLL